MADDWLCDNALPVTDIRWWGSYIGWEFEQIPTIAPESFHIGIWTDVPAGEDQTFSHPGQLIWEYMVLREMANETIDGCGFYPGTSTGYSFKYECNLPEEAWFYQQGQGTIYWLSVSAVYTGNEPSSPWGWKTREHNYNDDAVRISDPLYPTIASTFKDGSPVEEPAGTSWDLTFELIGNTSSTPTPTPTPTRTPTPTPTSTPVDPRQQLIDYLLDRPTGAYGDPNTDDRADIADVIWLILEESVQQ
jgi:hypothetical protein